jgi:hypothetical protein
MLTIGAADLLAQAREALDAGHVDQPFCLAANAAGHIRYIGLPGELEDREHLATVIAKVVMPGLLDHAARAYCMVLPVVVAGIEAPDDGEDGEPVVVGTMRAWGVYTDEAMLRFPAAHPETWFCTREDDGSAGEWSPCALYEVAPWTELMRRAISPQDTPANI